MEGPGADSEEKREPVSDINIAVVDSLKVLDPKRPIREANIGYLLLVISSVTRTACNAGPIQPSHLSFQPVQKTPTLCISSGFIGGIPVEAPAPRVFFLRSHGGSHDRAY